VSRKNSGSSSSASISKVSSVVSSNKLASIERRLIRLAIWQTHLEKKSPNEWGLCWVWFLSFGMWGAINPPVTALCIW
jgi:hypothetical protein